MGKWLSRINQNYVKHLELEGDKVDIVESDPTLSTLSPHNQDIYRDKSSTQIAKEVELRKLVALVSAHYGGDDEQFLEEYTGDLIGEWSHDLDKILVCLRNLCT
jgi:hypothetical protein